MNKTIEIPEDLKELYNHWEFHIRKSKILDKDFKLNKKDNLILKDIYIFINERMRIWENKQKNNSKYTTDPILAKYRFCNIYRELDRQTIELHKFLKPLRYDFDLWFLNMLVHRIIAKPEISQKLGFITFDNKRNQNILKKFYSLERPKFGTPYIFPVSILKNIKVKNREEFICIYIPENIKKLRDIYRKTTLLRVLVIF